MNGVNNPLLHHINFKTARLDEMIEWYGIVLGMHPNFYSPEAAFLTNDDANHRIAMFGMPKFQDDPDRITRAGMHHTAFEFESLEDLLSDYERLKAHGIEPVFTVDHGLTMSFYYSDPDGNQVELQADNFDNWADSSEWLRSSPDFVANTIGEQVSPDLLVAASREGVDAKEIHRRAYAGEFPPDNPVDLGALF